MALPTAYLTSTRSLEGIFNAIQTAKAPPKFQRRFLEDLGFKSSTDRLVINVFKALGLLSSDGSPTSRYFEFLDPTQSGRVLADALQDAYADLYQLDRQAHTRSRTELRGKVKTLTRGQVSDDVVNKMASTFLALARFADFSAPVSPSEASTDALPGPGESEPSAAGRHDGAGPEPVGGAKISLGGFVYNVELHLPESRDPAVYEALFRSLKTHLLS